MLSLTASPTQIVTIMELTSFNGVGCMSNELKKRIEVAVTAGPELMARETARLIASDKVEGTECAAAMAKSLVPLTAL